MDYLSSLLLLLLTIITAGIYFVRRRYSYWERNHVPSLKARFPFGNLQGLGSKYHICEVIQKIYYDLKDKAPLNGMYFFTNPVVMITDVDLVKTVLVKDFQYFQNRGMYFNEKTDPLTAHLFAIEGTKWRNLRAKISPTFTSGKMKMMFPTIVSVAEHFGEYVGKKVSEDSEIEMRDILSRYTTDVIGSCAFGLDCNSINDPEAKFRVMGKRTVDDPRHGIVGTFMMLTFRDLSKFLGMKVFHDDVSDFFMTAVRDTIDYREKNNIERPDFLSLMIKLKNTGSIDGDNEKNNGSDDMKLTFNEIAAQCFVFFLAGFETSSTTLSYALYELSLNQEAQEKARKCVQDVLKKHNGKMSYEAVLEMDYIDCCINESLRKYPPVPILNRELTNDYNVPNTNIVLKKGTGVIIPAYSIQHDPEHYPDPEKYIPERFSPEEVAARNPYTFLPFGEGPRVCIGLRFGMMQSRIGLAVLLKDFILTPCSKSDIPLKLNRNSFFFTPSSGLWLNIKKINSDN